MSCFKSGRNFVRNFCPNPVNPVPTGFENSKSHGFENSKSGAPLVIGSIPATVKHFSSLPGVVIMKRNKFTTFVKKITWILDKILLNNLLSTTNALKGASSLYMFECIVSLYMFDQMYCVTVYV